MVVVGNVFKSRGRPAKRSAGAAGSTDQSLYVLVAPNQHAWIFLLHLISNNNIYNPT